MTDRNSTNWLLAGTAALAILMGTPALLAQTAMAQEDSGGHAQQGQGEGQGKGQGEGQGGQGGGGHETGEHDDGGTHEDGGGHEDGKGGHTPTGGESPGQGQGGQGGENGGKPVWAQEGIPEVELGRLSVVRSPDNVLDRAFAEVLATFDPAMAAYYEMTADAFAQQARDNWDGMAIVDSPLQNLALLRELWTTSDTSLPGVDPASDIDLAAILLGVASDKTLAISDDTLRALAIIMGADLAPADISAIAARAEAVRRGVLAGHG